MLNRIFTYTTSATFALAFLALCGIIFFTFIKSACGATLCLGKDSSPVSCEVLTPKPALGPTLDDAWGLCQAHLSESGFPWQDCITVRNAMTERDRLTIQRALKR